jgi:ferredoxin
MVSKKIVLIFPPTLVGQPVVYKLVKDYDLSFNILRAKITPDDGEMVLEISGTKEHYAAGMKYLKDLGLKIEPLSKDIQRDESRCTQCGACVTICPSGALSMETGGMKVIFDPDKCIACELCIKGCPPRAMKTKIK